MQDWWQATFEQGCQTLRITDASGYPVSIAYGEKGEGKPLVLVHGIASWCYSWRHTIEPLSKYFRVICFDAKGTGFSEKSSYTEKPGHHVVELVRILRVLCDEPAVVVAISLGGLVSLAAAEEYPELFARLVVINVPIFPQRLPNQGMRLLSYLPIDLVRMVDQLRLASLFAPLLRQIVGFERREVLAGNTTVTEEEMYWISYPYIEIPGTITKYVEELQQAAREIETLGQNQPNLIRSVQEKLSTISCPTLILWGAQDRWFPATDGDKLHAHIPGSKLQIIPNCGHDAAVDCSAEVNSAILSFLRDTNFLASADVGYLHPP